MDSKTLRDARESLKMAETEFMDAVKEMNTAKVRYETAKTLLDATLEFQISELESEKFRSQRTVSSLENDKSNLRDELSKRDAEIERLGSKVREVEKQLEQCCRDIIAMKDEKTKPQVVVNRFVKSDKAFLDVNHKDGGRAGRIVIQLDVDTTPRTVEIFKAFFTGESDINPYYVGNRFAVDSGHIYTDRNTLDGRPKRLNNVAAENFVKKNVPGSVSLSFKDGCVYEDRFVINTVYNSKWEGNDVVFGHVIDGMETVMKIQMGEHHDFIISNCGLLLP